MKKNFWLLLVSSVLLLFTLSSCVLPATNAPSVQDVPKSQPTSAPPTLAIKTPIPTATKAASFQEILSGTQTALAIIRGGTPEGETTPTPALEMTEATGLPGMLNGTPEPAIPGFGTPQSTVSSTAMYGNATQLATTTTATPIVVAVFQGIPGVPTFGILKVTRDATVTIQTNEFPASTKYTVKMGPAYTYALGGTVVGTFDSAKGGTMNETLNIPAELKGSDRIDIRVEFPDGRYSYNYFFNLTVN